VGARRLIVLLSVGLAFGCGGVIEAPRPAEGPAPGLPEDPGWWRDAVFMEVFVRAYQDSDGDGIGDLRGLISRLDHLNDGDPATSTDLGVTGLWLMPVFESPSYHGYDATDYYRIESDYGTVDDLRDLVAACHERGIRVILDLVLNHVSWKHPWFRGAYRPHDPHHEWFIWSTEGHTWRGPWQQPVWHQLPWWQRGWRHFNHSAYYGIFWRGMPDLNHRNPEVVAATDAVARFWVTEVGVDGYRLDAARHLVEDGVVQEDTPETHQRLRGFTAALRAVRPDALVVGEIWDGVEVVSGYGPAEVDLAFQFELAEALVAGVRQGDATPIQQVHAAIAEHMPDHRYASFLANHDQNRVMWHMDGDVDRARLAAALLMTGPGTPFLYYGEEIGMTGHKPDPQIRTPMQWSGEAGVGFTDGRPFIEPKADAATVNVAAQTDDPNSLLSAYRRLVKARGSLPILRRGSWEWVGGLPETVVVARRRWEGDEVLVVANLAAETVDLSLVATDVGEPILVEGPERSLPVHLDGLSGLTLVVFPVAEAR
jgi:alpha-amylase